MRSKVSPGSQSRVWKCPNISPVASSPQPVRGRAATMRRESDQTPTRAPPVSWLRLRSGESSTTTTASSTKAPARASARCRQRAGAMSTRKTNPPASAPSQPDREEETYSPPATGTSASSQRQSLRPMCRPTGSAIASSAPSRPGWPRLPSGRGSSCRNPCHSASRPATAQPARKSRSASSRDAGRRHSTALPTNRPRYASRTTTDS